jgi:hypothetical protein
MFAAKMSLARLKTGPLNQVTIGAMPVIRGSDSWVIRAVLTGTFASMISSSGMDGNSNGVRNSLSRTDCGTNRDGAHQQRSSEGYQRASEVRLTRHFQSPFCRSTFDCGPMSGLIQ